MEKDDKELLFQKYADTNRQLKLAQQQLAAANQKLKEYEEKAQKAEKASRMKSLFLANMSHEIRTPLNAIEGFSRVLVETDSQEERLKYYEIIESNNRLMSLVNEILDLSRVESGEVVMKKSSVNLNELCDGIKNIFKFRCPDSIKLDWKKPTMNVTLNTDANRLTQVFSNLISNALKHTIKGSIAYGYRLLDEGADIEFFVKDTGSGIAPEDLEHIFETYVSRDAETTKNGYGLGLPLCKIIVEKLGGKISVESKLGEGSLFRFVFPFEGSIGGYEQARTTTNVRTIRVSERPDSMQRKCILVAEDEDSNYELVKIVLQKRYRLLRAHDGIEAVTMNEEEKPDLILMDIRMPGMNGLDATRIIKEVNPQTPIVALSAYAYDENIREAKGAGCDEFLAKPFKVENLIDTVKKFIDK